MKLLIGFLTMISSFSCHAASFDELIKGYDRSFKKSSFVEIREKYNFRPAYLVEFSDDSLYGMSRDGRGVARYSLVDAGGVSGWPLTRWPHHGGFEYNRPFFQNSIQGQDGGQYWLPANHWPTLGCLGQAPLRYGDIESDGKHELVLFLDNELVVFSPAHERIVFAETYDASNWENASSTADAYESFIGIGNEGVRYQYVSSDSYWSETLDWPGSRSYSKIYSGSFDDDTQFDLLVWRKLYISNRVGEAEGFGDAKKTPWQYQHFEQDPDTGEYLPQDTDEATVQQWLTDNNLRWPDGYPNVSECEGQEGQLIPEMHDPLLNDPEVLQ